MNNWISIDDEYRKSLEPYTEKNPERLRYFVEAFESAINFHGYNYIHAPDKDRPRREVDKLIEHLEASKEYFMRIGEITLANEIEWQIERLKKGENPEPTKKSIRRKARETMKEVLVPDVISKKQFKDDAAKLLDLLDDYLKKHPPSKPYWLNDFQIDPGDYYVASDFNIHD